MIFEINRKLVERPGGSYIVFLPKIWIKGNQLKHGDLLRVIFGEDKSLKIEATQLDANPSNN